MEASSQLDVIRAEQAALLAREPVRRPDVRELVRAANILPVFYDWTAVGGIRASDGEIVWVDYEAPYPVQREDNPRMRNTILFRAHLEYPALRTLIPVRPDDARDCAACHGTGTLRVDGVATEAALCYCGGTGWLPDTQPDAHEQNYAIGSPATAKGWWAQLKRWLRINGRQAAI